MIFSDSGVHDKGISSGRNNWHVTGGVVHHRAHVPTYLTPTKPLRAIRVLKLVSSVQKLFARDFRNSDSSSGIVQLSSLLL
jgi:hypothetical protein